MKRDLDTQFLNAMRDRLEHGRRQGREGWDRRWGDAVFPTPNPEQCLLDSLNRKVLELAIALDSGNKEKIKHKAADVSNFAMMIADITGSLDVTDNGGN